MLCTFSTYPDPCHYTTLLKAHYVSTGRHLGASARDTVALLEREMRETRRLDACVRVRGAHFEASSTNSLIF